ncbi:heat shock 70 kDa protein 12A-like [Saccostrea cucullata]|uniref:heat shock 70 kDa protein 12A-like n=1 Tax=Saccostrea cuccullata TaxID=36930 RepID=UPI002ED3669A
MMNIIIGHHEMGNFQKQHNAEFQDLFLSFERAKTHKSTFSNKDVELHIPSGLKTLIKKEFPLKDSIERYLKGKGTSTDSITCVNKDDEFYLRLKVKVMELLFKPMLDITEKTIDTKFKDDMGSEIKCVCVIGGYANSPLVQKTVRKKFKLRTVVIPKNADLVVAKGAVYYGYKYHGKEM